MLVHYCDFTDSVAADQVDDVAGSSVAAELESELADSTPSSNASPGVSGAKALATPAVRRIAAENKVCVDRYQHLSLVCDIICGTITALCILL